VRRGWGCRIERL